MFAASTLAQLRRSICRHWLLWEYHVYVWQHLHKAERLLLTVPVRHVRLSTKVLNLNVNILQAWRDSRPHFDRCEANHSTRVYAYYSTCVDDHIARRH